MSVAFNEMKPLEGYDYSEKVAAVVVTYNRIHSLIRCIECLLAQECDIPLTPIIIDNASTDGTEERLLPYIESGRVLYQNTGSNLGGAGGFNFGMKYAAELGFKWQWVMDDDCFPTASALQELIEFDVSVDGDYGFLCSKALWKDGSICTMNVPRRTMYRNLDYSEQVGPTRITMASFVSLFLRTERVFEFGLPIKEFFIWTDDWEFTRRISKKMPCYAIPSSVVNHHSASNIGADIALSDSNRLDRFRYLYRNDVFLYRREGLSGFIYEVARLFKHSVSILLHASDGKMERLLMMARATADGVHFNPSIEYPSRGK